MLMDYRIKRVGQSDELEHALFGIGKKKSSSSSGSGSGQQGAKKGSTWSNHLYIARQKAGDGWRYFYSQAELKAAQAKQAGQKAAKTVSDTARKGLATVKRAGSKAADIASGKYARDIDQNISRRKEYIDTRNNIANASAERWMDTQKQIDANKAHGDSVAADLRKRTKDLEDIEKVYGKKSEQYRVMNEDASKIADELNNYSKEAKRLETKSKKSVDAARPWWNEDLEQRKKLAAEETARDNDTAYKVSKFFNNPKAELKKAGEKAKANIDDGVAKVKRAVKDTARDVEWAVDDAKDVVKNTAKKIKNEANDVLSGEYKKKIDEDYNRTQEDQRRRYNTDERLNKKASEYRQKRDDAGPIFNEDGTKNLEFFNNNDKLTETLFRDQDNSSKIKENRDKIAELDKERSSIKYGAATAISKATTAINKGKSAISKFLSDESAMAKEAWNGSIAKKAIDKGKNAIDALAKWRRDVSASHVTFTSDLPSLSKSGKKYYKDAIKNLTDEEIEQDYLSAKRKNSTSPQENDKFELLTAERNYRVASREADRLGRLTDTKSDAAEAALKKYGQDSPQYKKAFDEMEEAFDQLHEAEMELARYEKNR